MAVYPLNKSKEIVHSIIISRVRSAIQMTGFQYPSVVREVPTDFEVKLKHSASDYTIFGEWVSR
jgi:hypothetical protein